MWLTMKLRSMRYDYFSTSKCYHLTLGPIQILSWVFFLYIHIYTFIMLRFHGPRTLHGHAWYNQKTLDKEGCTKFLVSRWQLKTWEICWFSSGLWHEKIALNRIVGCLWWLHLIKLLNLRYMDINSSQKSKHLIIDTLNSYKIASKHLFCMTQ